MEFYPQRFKALKPMLRCSYIERRDLNATLIRLASQRS